MNSNDDDRTGKMYGNQKTGSTVVGLTYVNDSSPLVRAKAAFERSEQVKMSTMYKIKACPKGNLEDLWYWIVQMDIPARSVVIEAAIAQGFSETDAVDLAIEARNKQVLLRQIQLIEQTVKTVETGSAVKQMMEESKFSITEELEKMGSLTTSTQELREKVQANVYKEEAKEFNTEMSLGVGDAVSAGVDAAIKVKDASKSQDEALVLAKAAIEARLLLAQNPEANEVADTARINAKVAGKSEDEAVITAILAFLAIEAAAQLYFALELEIKKNQSGLTNQDKAVVQAVLVKLYDVSTDLHEKQIHYNSNRIGTLARVAVDETYNTGAAIEETIEEKKQGVKAKMYEALDRVEGREEIIFLRIWKAFYAALLSIMESFYTNPKHNTTFEDDPEPENPTDFRP